VQRAFAPSLSLPHGPWILFGDAYRWYQGRVQRWLWLAPRELVGSP
jgi:hypothetical protein